MPQVLDTHEFLGQADWSPDGQQLAYLKGEKEIWVAESRAGREPRRVLDPGTHPCWIGKDQLLAESSGELALAEPDRPGRKVLVSRSDIHSPSAKNHPIAFPATGAFVFACHFLFDRESQSKNAYANRHLLAVGSLKENKVTLIRQQWYGGTLVFFPNGERFAHFEFDSTGGAQIHVVSMNGKEEAVMGGHFPAPSPSGAEIAAKPKGGGGLLVIRRKGEAWDTDALETLVLRLPEASGRLSANPPWWLDERTVIVEEGRKLFRLDVRSEKSSLWMEIPGLAERGEATLWPSPDRSRLAAVVRADETDQLVVLETPRG